MLSVKRIVAVAFILGGTALLAAALMSSETDEEAISRQLHALADAVATREGEGLLYRRARLDGMFSDILSENVRLDAPELGPPEQGRAEVTMLATRAGTLYQAGRVELHDLDIRVGESGTLAAATARAAVIASGGSETLRREDRRVVFGLDKQDGHWRVASVGVAESEDWAP